MSDSDDDKPGYRKPPRATRFKPGISGNPKGRPKQSNNVAAAINKQLDQRITVKVNGKSKRMTLSDVIAFKMVRTSADGDWAALSYLVKIVPNRFRLPSSETRTDEIVSEADDAIIKRFLQRHIQVELDAKGPSHANAGSKTPNNAENDDDERP